MGPKKIGSAEEVNDDTKKSLDFLSEEITNLKLQQKVTFEMVEEEKVLHHQHIEKDTRITFLENRAADWVQYTGMNDSSSLDPYYTPVMLEQWLLTLVVNPVRWMLTPQSNKWQVLAVTRDRSGL